MGIRIKKTFFLYLEKIVNNNKHSEQTSDYFNGCVTISRNTSFPEIFSSFSGKGVFREFFWEIVRQPIKHDNILSKMNLDSTIKRFFMRCSIKQLHIPRWFLITKNLFPTQMEKIGKKLVKTKVWAIVDQKHPLLPFSNTESVRWNTQGSFSEPKQTKFFSEPKQTKMIEIAPKVLNLWFFSPKNFHSIYFEFWTHFQRISVNGRNQMFGLTGNRPFVPFNGWWS